MADKVGTLSVAIEAAFTIACLENGRIPASAGFTTPDPELKPAFPVRQNVSISGRIALSETLACFLLDKRPTIPQYSLCMECKRRAIPCILVSGGNMNGT